MVVREGFNIIPCLKNEKRPSINWIEFQNKMYPPENLKDHDGNFAVICGPISNNLVVIDLDFKAKINTDEAFKEIWKRFAAKFPSLMNTYAVRSPHGFHIYFRTKLPLKKRAYKGDSVHFHKLLRGIDIQAEGSIIVIPPSSINGTPYREILPFDPIVLSKDKWKRVEEFFIKVNLQHLNYFRMRKPFKDILEGKIEIESYAKEKKIEEFLLWKFLFVEARIRCDIEPPQLYERLKKSQPSFDVEKTEIQLKHHPPSVKPLTQKKMIQFFPDYEHNITKPKGSPPVYIEIADYLIDKYDLITMDDSDEILIRRGNACSLDLKNFYNDIADEVAFCNKTLVSVNANILKRVIYKTKFYREDLCYDKWIISFQNGYYKVEEQTFVPIKEDNSKLFCYEIPHDYPEKEYDCPKFKAILEEWLGEDNKVRPNDIFEMIGYTMTMNTDMKMAFFIFGPSNSGKTQYQTVLEHVIGHGNRANVSLQRMCKDQFGTNGLQFKLLNMVGDMSDLSVKDVSAFKTFTGDDKFVDAEIKAGKQYQFRNIVKMWYNGNKIPIIERDDPAFYNRWLLIEFPNIFSMFDTGTIKGLGEIICEDKDEIKGVICEALKGAHRLAKRQYFRKEIIINTRHTWKYFAEPIYAFISDYCIRDECGDVSCDEFRTRLNSFLAKRKIRPLTAYKLNLLIENYGLYKKRLSNYDREYVYSGIRWKSGIEKFSEPDEE